MIASPSVLLNTPADKIPIQSLKACESNEAFDFFITRINLTQI